MLFPSRIDAVRAVRDGLAILTCAAGVLAPVAVRAQSPSIVKTIAGYLNTGGYFFTGNAGSSNSLGTPKFFNASGYYTRPKHIGEFAISGGLENVNAGDHFLPFSGGNEFNLFGPAGRVAVKIPGSHFTPFLTAGLFLGRIRSENLGFDVTQFTPSGSVGLEYAVAKDLKLQASYRVSQNINRVNTNGFGISLRFQ